MMRTVSSADEKRRSKLSLLCFVEHRRKECGVATRYLTGCTTLITYRWIAGESLFIRVKLIEMKPNTKSPYFYLFILFSIAVFVQAIIMSNILKDQVLSDSPLNSDPITISYCLGFLFTGLAALFYFKTTKKKQTTKNQILVFALAPIALSPIIILVISLITILPLYELNSLVG